MIFGDINKNINSVIDHFSDIVVEAMDRRKEEFIDLNVSQIEKGQTKTGAMITPEYESDHYATLKKAMGSQAPIFVPDLKLTGDFLSGMYAEKYIGTTEESSGLFIGSHDDKAGKLEKKYDNIYGISPENSGIYEEILEDVQKTEMDEITR
jgi:hypothetical protein